MENTKNEQHIRQRLIDRITNLKKDKENLFDKKHYEDGRFVVPMSISSNTKHFYNHTYDRLIQELEDILNGV